jgi:hypothetical protein
MNAPHEEAAEFAKQSKRENRVYVGNLSYDVKYRDLIEFMRGGGLGHFSISFFEVLQVGRCGEAWPLSCSSVEVPAARVGVNAPESGDVGSMDLFRFSSGFLMDVEVVRIG